MIRALILALAAVLAACGGGGGTTTTTTTPEPDPLPTPEASGPTCQNAADNAIVNIRGDAADQLTEDQYTRVHATILQSCQSEPWPPEALRCVAEASGDEMDACEKSFPEEMAERVGDAVGTILEEGSGDVPQ